MTLGEQEKHLDINTLSALAKNLNKIWSVILSLGVEMWKTASVKISDALIYITMPSLAFFDFLGLPPSKMNSRNLRIWCISYVATKPSLPNER